MRHVILVQRLETRSPRSIACVCSMKGKSRIIPLLTWPVKSFFDGQPSAFTRNSSSPSQPYCRTSLTRRSSAPYKLSCRLADYGSICASSGLTAISGRAGGHTVRPGPLVGLQTHLMLSPSCWREDLFDFCPSWLIGFVFKLLAPTQLVSSACSLHTLLHSSTRSVSPPLASALS